MTPNARHRQRTMVLAAGAGARLASVTRGVPKQYWHAAGWPSLLDDTLERFRPFTAPGGMIVVVDASHRRYVHEAELFSRAQVMMQPRDRGTAAGVLLGLLPVLAYGDPIVTVTPADHGVANLDTFAEGLRMALEHAQVSDDIVLFGVEATEAHDDFGWVTPGAALGDSRLRRVQAFVEKPTPGMAGQLLRSGAAWNTMVVVGRARALGNLITQQVPELKQLFEVVRDGSRIDHTALAAIYQDLRTYDFSHDVLTHAGNLVTYVWPSTIGWTDLGTPARLIAWKRRRQMRPATVGGVTS